MAGLDKKFSIGYLTGKTLYLVVKKDADGYLLNDADGTFAAAPADPYVSFTEDATLKGYYAKTEGRTAWADGTYISVIYEQLAGAPALATDWLCSMYSFDVKNDVQINSTEIFNLIATVGAANSGSSNFVTIKLLLNTLTNSLSALISIVRDIQLKMLKKG
jgi:hypothetical protein